MSRTQMSMCQCEFLTCNLVCHLVTESSNKRLVFNLPKFQGMNCFEIGHALQNSGMFVCQHNSKQKIGLRTSHPEWPKLREMYGLANKKRARQDNSNAESCSEFESEIESAPDEDEIMGGGRRRR